MKTRPSWRVLAGAVCVLVSASACGGADTDDPASVASSVMNAVAESDCKAVAELFPTAAEDADYPAAGCTNELDQSRAVGEYACTVDPAAKTSPTHTAYNCVSSDDPSLVWGVSLDRATDAWVVTSILATPA